MKKINVLLILITVSILSACYYDNREDLYLEFPKDCNLSGLTYTLDIEPLVSQNCFNGCHGPSGAYIPLFTIEELRKNESKIRIRINLPKGDGELMPPNGPMTMCNIDKLIMWFDIGTPE